ncbi:hypothetical protein Tco_0596697 [Tanacetum coccineum]
MLDADTSMMIANAMKSYGALKEVTPSAPRLPNPATETAELSVPKRSTMIRFRLPSRQSARLTPPVPVPTVEKADEMILQDTIQVSLAEHKSREEQEQEQCSTEVDYISPIPSPTRSPRNLSTLVSSDIEKLQELMVTHPTPSSEKVHATTSCDQLADNLHDVMIETLPSLVKEKVTEQVKRRSFAQIRDQFAYAGHISSQIQSKLTMLIHLYDASYALYADPLLQQQDIAIWLALQIKFEKTQDDPYAEAYPEGETSAKGQKSSEYEAILFIRSSVILGKSAHFQLESKAITKDYLTQPIITFLGIEEYDVFSIVYEPVHGIIYTNSKKEKRVMRHSEIHKFCDATLRRTLEGLKSYYNDVKYGYVQKELINDEVEFLKLFEEEIEVQLNYRDQMRR